MKVKVKKEKCIGCGLCSNLCTSVFKMEEGKSHIKEDANFEENKDCIKEAVNGCPTSAIEIED